MVQKRVYKLSFLLGNDLLVERDFCKEFPLQLFLNLSCVLKLTDLFDIQTEEDDMKKYFKYKHVYGSKR